MSAQALFSLRALFGATQTRALFGATRISLLNEDGLFD